MLDNPILRRLTTRSHQDCCGMILQVGSPERWILPLGAPPRQNHHATNPNPLSKTVQWNRPKSRKKSRADFPFSKPLSNKCILDSPCYSPAKLQRIPISEIETELPKGPSSNHRRENFKIFQSASQAIPTSNNNTSVPLVKLHALVSHRKGMVIQSLVYGFRFPFYFWIPIVGWPFEPSEPCNLTVAHLNFSWVPHTFPYCPWISPWLSFLSPSHSHLSFYRFFHRNKSQTSLQKNRAISEITKIPRTIRQQQI